MKLDSIIGFLQDDLAQVERLLREANAVLGRLVSVNEKLGELIDPASMEVAFRVTNTQFSRMLGEQRNNFV